jgi:hypothetical protein
MVKFSKIHPNSLVREKNGSSPASRRFDMNSVLRKVTAPSKAPKAPAKAPKAKAHAKDNLVELAAKVSASDSKPAAVTPEPAKTEAPAAPAKAPAKAPKAPKAPAKAPAAPAKVKAPKAPAKAPKAPAKIRIKIKKVHPTGFSREVQGVLNSIKKPRTVREIMDMAGVDVSNRIYVSSILIKMTKAGKVVEGGERECAVSGRVVKTYMLAD